MKVFVCDISNVSSDSLDKAASFLSLSEKERLQSMISVKRQREFIAGHYLLRMVLSCHYNRPIETLDVQTLQSGALFLTDRSLGYVSLSHSFEHVAIALGAEPLGLDMEKMRPKNNFNEILEQIDSVKAAGELMKQGFSLQESFFRLWTKREAVYKLNSLIEVPNKEKIHFSYHKNNDFILCVAANKELDVSWEKVEFEKC